MSPSHAFASILAVGLLASVTLSGARGAAVTLSGAREASAVEGPPERYIPVLDVGATLPDLPLTDQGGRPFSLRSPDGRLAIVSFIYTRCQDANECPLISAKFERLQTAIDPRTMRLVEITLDPRFDTPAVLERYGRAYRARFDRWSLVTGSPEAIEEVTRRLGVTASWVRGDLEHSEELVILSAGGRIAERIQGNDWTDAQALALAQDTVWRQLDPFTRITVALSSGVAAICGNGRSGITLAAAIGIFLVLVVAFSLAARRALRRFPANPDASASNRTRSSSS